MPPAAVGPFKIERELGRGGMGVVYLATDTRLDRPVAIKALPADLASDSDRLARFQREAKVLALLSHPNVGGIYGLETAEGQQYLVLEYIEGETLADRLAAGPLAVGDALTLAKQIAGALEAAHEKGIIHRDLKPGNVMVTSNGVVKVLDFGLARTADGSPSSTNVAARADSPTVTSPARHSPTIPGAIMGTAGYMSPEQARGRPVDKRSDIFSFGCVLFEMLSGAGPFPGETVTDSLGAILHREPDWAMLPPATPPAVGLILRRCLVKDRGNRLHDIADARIEIEQAIAEPFPAGFGPTGADGRHSRTRGALAMVGALVAGMVLAGGAWLAVGRGRPSTGSTGAPHVSIELPKGFTARRVGISRDGRQMITSGFMQNADGSSDRAAESRSFAAFLRGVDSYAVRRVPVTGLREPWAFAPDSQSVAIVVQVAADTARKRIIRVPVSGDAPSLTIADLPTDLAYFVMTWATPDEILVCQESPPVILKVDVATGRVGKPLALELPSKSPNLESVVSLPGGGGILGEISYYGETGYVQSINRIDPTTGAVDVLVSDGANPRYVPTGHLLFSRGDALLAVRFDPSGGGRLLGAPEVISGGLRTRAVWAYGIFDVSDNGTLVHLPGGLQGGKRRLMVFDDAGKMTPWTPDERTFQGQPAVSCDGRRVATTVTNGSGINEVWVSRTDRTGFDRAAAAPNVDCDPVAFTPDGLGLVAWKVGISQAENGLYLFDLAGSKPPLLVMPLNVSEGYNAITQMACVPDGTALLVPVTSGIRVDVKRVDLRSERKAEPEVILAGLQGPVTTAVSPDGKWLVWGRMDGDRNGVFIAPMPAPGAGGVRGDGAQLAGAATIRVWFKATGPGEPMVLTYLDNKGRAFTGTLVTTPAPGLKDVKLTGDATDRRVVENDRGILEDGHVVAVVAGEEEEPPTSLSVVFNWFDELRRKMPTK